MQYSLHRDIDPDTEISFWETPVVDEIMLILAGCHKNSDLKPQTPKTRTPQLF